MRSARVEYHREVYDLLMAELRAALPGARGRVVGGGRVAYDARARTARVYGYSRRFGRARGCNQRTAAMIAEAMPGVAVEWSDRGY